MKRIVFFVDSFPSYSETFIYNQIYFLLDKGFYVRILALKARNGLSISPHKKMIEYGLESKCDISRTRYNLNIVWNFLKFPLISISFLRNWNAKKSFFFIQNLNLLLKYSDFDIIHSHYGHLGALVCDLKSFGFFKNSKLICSFHGEDVSHNYPGAFQKKYFNIEKFADVITVNSQYTFERLVISVDKVWNNLVILPVPVDVDFFKPSYSLKQIKNYFKILFCGRLIELKAPTFAIKIVNELVRLGYPVQLDIVGDGKEHQNCLDLISNLGLENSVKLHGALSQESLINIFEQADIFLFPGIKESKTLKSEAQGLVLQEAQAMQLPVVISNAGGMKYGIIDGVTGFVVQENDLFGFVDSCIRLLENPDLRASMGLAGREFVETNFDINFIGGKLLNMYGLNSFSE